MPIFGYKHCDGRLSHERIVMPHLFSTLRCSLCGLPLHQVDLKDIKATAHGNQFYIKCPNCGSLVSVNFVDFGEGTDSQLDSVTCELQFPINTLSLPASGRITFFCAHCGRAHSGQINYDPIRATKFELTSSGICGHCQSSMTVDVFRPTAQHPQHATLLIECL